MIALIKSKMRLKISSTNYIEYEEHVRDLLIDEKVQSMKEYIQHSNVTCLDHCLYVSYTSYRVTKFFGFNHREAARGALLHDFFLYDWHETKPDEGLHGFHHSKIALRNANSFFTLSELEKDIIEKHMWPLTLTLPKYKESFIVMFVDKFCASMEIIKKNKKEC